MVKLIKKNLKRDTLVMNKTELFNRISDDLKNKLHLLVDKPDETIETTLKALWLKAAGFQVSAKRSLDLSIPDLTDNQIQNLFKLIDLRINNTPLAHITNRQNFMGIEFISDKRALIPRKETELLGKKALETVNRITRLKSTINVMDICCGSGNLGLAIALLNSNCIVYATDISNDAVELTKDNINLLDLNQRVQVKQGDLFSAFETYEFYEKVDLIVCNPPYILSSKVLKMDKEIALNEPILAFDGGMLGIKIIQKIITDAPKFLTSEGFLIFEVGVGQGSFVIQLCERKQLYQLVESYSDDSNNIRVVLTQKIKRKLVK
jgi:release factor glutamine methyltransferase